MTRPLALMMPAVTVCPSPKGFPEAITQSPTRMEFESPSCAGFGKSAPSSDLNQSNVSFGITGNHFGVIFLARFRLDFYFVRLFNDVVIGKDESFAFDDKPGAQCVGFQLALRPLSEISLKEFVTKKIPEGRIRADERLHRTFFKELRGGDIDDGMIHPFGQIGKRRWSLPSKARGSSLGSPGARKKQNQRDKNHIAAKPDHFRLNSLNSH